MREKLPLHLAIFSGFRPGEMLGLQRRHVALDCSSVIVEHRVYRGVIDVPNIDPSAGEVAIPPRDGRVHIRPKLKPHGLGWVDFQVMRATHASIGHRLALNPKVTADQHGHGVGVSIAEYTKTSLKDRQSQLGSWKTLLWASRRWFG